MQIVGSRPFRSAVLSFCAMLSGKRPARATDDGGFAGDREEERRGVWDKPGNFNGNSSALIWMAQMMLFEHTCELGYGGDDWIPENLQGLCRSFLNLHVETAFGHMLGWRAHLFDGVRHSVSKN